MATIIQRGPEQFQVKIRRKGQPMISHTLPTRKQAEAWARKKEVELDEGRYVCQRGLKSTLFKHWLERYRDQEAPKWKNGYDMRKQCNVLLGRSIAKLPVVSLRPEDFEHEIAELKAERQLSEQTARHYLNRCSAVFETAIEVWRIPGVHNPVKLIRRPKIKNTRRLRPKRQQWDAILLELRKSHNPFYPLVTEFAIETLAREGEIVNLRIPDIDFDGHTATLWETKNGERRTVPLSERAVEIIGEAVSQRNFHVGAKLSRGGRLRVKQYGPDVVFPVYAKAWRRALYAAARRAGVDGVWIHDTRSQGINRLIREGWGITEVAAVSGHKSLQVLKEHYAEHHAEELAQKMRAPKPKARRGAPALRLLDDRDAA